MSKYFVENSEFGLNLHLSWIEKNPKYELCKTCNGTGRLPDPNDIENFGGFFTEGIRCWACGGTKETKIFTFYPSLPQVLIDRLTDVMKEFGKEYDDDWKKPFDNCGDNI